MEQKAQQRAERTDPGYRVWEGNDKRAPKSSHGLEGGGIQETQRRKGWLVLGEESACFLGCLESQATARASEGTSAEVAMRVKMRTTWGLAPGGGSRDKGVRRGRAQPQ